MIINKKPNISSFKVFKLDYFTLRNMNKESYCIILETLDHQRNATVISHWHHMKYRE